MTKDINGMRAVINTSGPSLGKEGIKTIKSLNRQIVLKTFTLNSAQKIPKKPSKTLKI